MSRFGENVFTCRHTDCGEIIGPLFRLRRGSKSKAFLDEVRLPEIFILEPNLCLKVYDDNLANMLT